MFPLPITTYLAFLKLYLLFGIAAEHVSTNHRCGPGINTPGWTVPRGDIILEFGSPLEIYCILDLDNPLAAGHTAHDLIFKNASQLIDRRHVEVINSTTARLHMENLPISDEMFYCQLVLRNVSANTVSSSSLETPNDTPDRLVCLNSVVIGSKPKNVDNFECVSHNWETLNCTWTQPYNGVKTNYSVYYRTPHRAGRNHWFKCAFYEDSKCSWTLSSSPVYRRAFEYMVFLVEGVNKFGNNSQEFKIHHYAHVIPSAPQLLTAVSKTPSSIHLQWSIGALQIFEKGLDYKVKYTWNSSLSWNVTIYSSQDIEKDRDFVRLNVTGLKYPNTPYDFRVYMKSSVANGETSWSPAASLVVKTKSCAPYHPPQTDIGSFETHRQHLASRDVSIYWQQLPLEEHNGDDFKYEITVFEEDSEINIVPVSITNRLARFNNLSFNGHKFVIRSVNVEGYSPYSSIVYVPRKQDVLPEPVLFTKVDFGGGIYELSWKLQNTTDNKTNDLTIFWCESNREYPYPCDSFLNWTHLPADTNKFNFTAKSSSGYQFAISANSVNSSSGMVWALCTVLHNQVNKMKSVWVQKSGSTFIEVKWKLECSERVKGILGYNMTYCPVSEADKSKCEEPESRTLVYGDVTTAHGNITGLKPFTMYKISVAMFTDQLSGQPSEAMYNRTKDSAPDMKDMKVEIQNITDRSALVKWNAPTIQNGIIDHYEVHYNDNTISVNNTFVLLIGLTSYTLYNIRVRACTAFCAQTDIVGLHTKIGAPTDVIKPTNEKINSSHTKLKWSPPTILAGPNPMYEVKVQYDESDENSTIEQFETSDTEAVVKIPCRQDTPHLSYTFYVRAKNTDDSDPTNVRQFVGPWSSAYTIDCMHSSMPPTWKLMFSITSFVFMVAMFGYIFKTGFIKCREMKKVEVVLPQKFIIPQMYTNELKNPAYHVHIKSWPDHNEVEHLNAKLSDIDQSSIDCIDTDIDTDRETTSRSSSGCYTS